MVWYWHGNMVLVWVGYGMSFIPWYHGIGMVLIYHPQNGYHGGTLKWVTEVYVPSFYICSVFWPHSHLPRIVIWNLLACPDIFDIFTFLCGYHCIYCLVSCVLMVLQGFIHMYISHWNLLKYLPILCNLPLTLLPLYQVHLPLMLSSLYGSLVVHLGSGQHGNS